MTVAGPARRPRGAALTVRSCRSAADESSLSPPSLVGYLFLSYDLGEWYHSPEHVAMPFVGREAILGDYILHSGDGHGRIGACDFTGGRL